MERNSVPLPLPRPQNSPAKLAAARAGKERIKMERRTFQDVRSMRNIVFSRLPIDTTAARQVAGRIWGLMIGKCGNQLPSHT